MSLIYNGFLRDKFDPLQFARGDKTADEGNHTDCQREGCGDFRKYVETAADARHCKAADDCRGRAAETVKESDHLRHLNHLDFLSDDEARRCTECKTYIKRPYSVNAVALDTVDDRLNDSEEHTYCADAVADFAEFYVAHHSDSAQNARRQSDGYRKVRPLRVIVAAHKRHCDYNCKDTCADRDGDCVDKGLLRRFLFGNHSQHSVGNHKAADDVDHCKRDGK